MAKLERLAIALNINKLNKNSFIAIICALEKEKETKKIPICLLFFLLIFQISGESIDFSQKFYKV